MSKIKYSEKLKDPRWQKKRLEILQRDEWKCRWCGTKTDTLHVHHIFYLPGREPWNIPNGFLITLCLNCHLPGNPDYDDPPQAIIELIGTLLDDIWKHDTSESDCVSSLERAINAVGMIPCTPEDMK